VTADQLQYTSCRRGVRGSAGFQVRSHSEGLPPGLVEECARRCHYRPPLDLPAEPQPHELGVFPRAFRWWTTAEGRPAAAMVTYVGRDYSGRFGNYFAHCLVFRESPPDGRPLDWYEWPGWQRALLPEEDTAETPPPLPPVELPEAPVAPSFAPAELAAFLAEGEEPERRLAQIVRATLRRAADRRPVIVRAGRAAGLYWLACVQRALPADFARQLSWSTYQYDAQGLADVNASTGRTALSADRAGWQANSALFDFPADREAGWFHRAPEPPDDYAAFAAAWLRADGARLDRLHSFAEAFEATPAEHALDAVARLFAVRDAGWVPAPEQLADMVTAAGRFGRPTAADELLAAVEAAVDAAGPHAQPPVWAAVVAWLAPRAPQRAARRWAEMFAALCCEHGQPPAPVVAAWDAVEPQAGAAALCQALLADDIVARVTAGLPAATTAALEALVRWLARARRVLGRPPALLRTALSALRARIAPQDAGAIHAVLEAMDGPEDVAAACLDLLDDAAPETRRAWCASLGVALRHLLASHPPAEARRVRAALAARGEPVLWAEAIARLAAAPSVLAEYRGYRATVLAELPAYAQAVTANLAWEVWQRTPETQRLELVDLWLDSDDPQWFDPTLVDRVLDAALAAIPLAGDDPAVDRRAERLAGWARRWNVEVTPDLPRLRALQRAARAPRAAGTAGAAWGIDAAGLRDALRGATAGQYAEFLGGWLEPALRGAATADELRETLEAAWLERHDRVFADAWVGVMEGGEGAARWDPLREQCLLAALRWSAGQNERRRDVSRDVLAAAAAALGRLSGKDLERAAQRLTAAASEDRVLKLKCSDFLQNVQDDRGRLFRRLGRALRLGR
jgi:hypothetical protein